MKGDKMFELYAKFIGENESAIVDDFCNKIKEEMDGALTLDEYSRFRFWKNHVNKELIEFYSRFRGETKTDMPFDSFCELMWKTMGDIMPEDSGELMEMMNSVKTIGMGEA